LRHFARKELYIFKSQFTDFEEDCDDIANILFTNLFSSFTTSEMWEKTIENNNDNNKKILKYIYRTINTATREFFIGTPYEEDIKLWQAINEILKDLADNNRLVVQTIGNTKFYHAGKVKSPISYETEIARYDGPRISFWRGDDKEERKQRDLQSIKTGVLEIIYSLEKFKFTVSDISGIIKDNSNFDIRYRYIRRIDPKRSGTSSLNDAAGDENLFVDTGRKPDVNANDFRIKADGFLKHFKALYPMTNRGQKTFQEDIKILYWTKNERNLTLEQIALSVFNDSRRFRIVHYRQESINKKLQALRENKKIVVDEEAESEMNAILELIENRFITKSKI
jgi:hypothetical protein